MPNIASAHKRSCQSDVRNQRNRQVRSQIHHVIRGVKEAVSARDIEKAQRAFSKAESVIQKGVTKNILHWRTAARRVSFLCRLLKSLSEKPV